MAKATIWNPNTGAKQVIEAGSAMPTGFSLWTGGNASGEQAMNAIKTASQPKQVNTNPVQTAPTVIPSTKLNPAQSDVKTISANKQLGVDRITNFFGAPTFDQTVMDKTANQAFLNAVSMASKGTVDPTILGEVGTVRSILDKYGLSQYAQNFGIKGDAPANGGTNQPPKQDGVISAIDGVIANKQSTMQDPIDLTGMLEAKQEAATSLEMARQKIAEKNLIDEVTFEGMRNQPILTASINANLNRYNNDQKLEILLNTQDYNNKLILSNIANGNFLEAQKINQDIASDNYEIEKLKIEKAKQQGIIDEATQARLDKENEYQRTLAENGYVYLSGPSQLKGLREDQIYRDPINGKIYKKPEVSPTYNSATVQEYQFYAENEKAAGRTPMSFNEYQNMDANRKAKSSGGGSGKDNSETAAFKKDLSTALQNLAADPSSWGTNWNYMYSRYKADLEAGAAERGMTAQAFLDELLNKEMFAPAKEEKQGGGIFDRAKDVYSNVVDWYNSLSGDTGGETTTPMIK